MQRIDLDLVRILIRQLCKLPTEEGGPMHPYGVSDFGAAQGYAEARESVRAHNGLLVEKGIARVERIQMTYHPGSAVLMPTEKGTLWCRRAHDDDRWEASREELESLLNS